MMANKISKVSDDVTKRASQLLKKLMAGTIAFEEDIELDLLMEHDLLKKRIELGEHLAQLSGQY
jgi:anthranilate/para-aminobenzoate synthase component I